MTPFRHLTSWATIAFAAISYHCAITRKQTRQILGCLLLLLGNTVAAEQIRVMQWNIKSGLGNIAQNNSAAAQAIARIVNYNQPDILLFCEVTNAVKGTGGVAADTTALINWVTNNVPYLGSQLGVTFFVAVSSTTDTYIRNAAISRYPILNETTYDDGLRGLHAFTVQLTTTNLQVFHAHLKASGGSSCTTKQTEAQFDADTISAWASTNSFPYLFGGDWNEDEDPRDTPECTITGTYHPITTIKQDGGLSEFEPTTLSGQWRTWSTASTPSIRFDYLLPATNRLSPIAGFVFSTMDWANYGLYTNASSQKLVNDTQTASDHFCVFADYSFSAAGLSLAVSPTNGLMSGGSTGGPFSPSSQTYTLTNGGSGSLNWTASKSANWLTISATNGTLAAGARTDITVSINTNAASLAPGSYSDTVSFANASTGAGSATRSVSLTVLSTAPQLSVSPASGLTASGPVGGPLSPPSQTYSLTNVGGANLNWTATNIANWLTLSLTGGTLAPGAGTNVILSLNTNANALAAGSYSDTVTFANLNNGAGNTTRAVSLTVSSFGFYDDFSAFAAGNLVGQSNWVQMNTQSGTPLQVSSGQVIIPVGQTADTQDAYKNFTQTNTTLFYGLTLTVNSAVNNSSPSYFAAMYTGNNASGFANYRLTAKAGSSGKTNCLLGIRITGESGDPYTFGTTTLSTGIQYRVIVQAPSGYGTASVYVNPTSAGLAGQAVYASNPISTGTAPTSLGSFVISQYGTTGVPTDGVSIGKVVVSDNFATVYNALTGVVPPPVASFAGNPASGTEPLTVAFTDTSTGSITNRSWNFGDGTTTNTTATNVTHIYAAGTYCVTLVASGSGGASTNSQPNCVAAWTPFQNWQILYFGSTTNAAAAPDADPDNDGMSNWAEFMAATNPTNSASALCITAVAQEGNDLRVTWTMGSGKINVLQEADSVGGTNSFADVFTVWTVGSVTNYLDVGAATNTPGRYYRVRLGP